MNVAKCEQGQGPRTERACLYRIRVDTVTAKEKARMMDGSVSSSHRGSGQAGVDLHQRPCWLVKFDFIS